ncbi:MAG: hypothetical protein RMY29_003345 [Nostoc sp. CreGUA01]|nr:hypothetical protein [Nostoc sp. CreGUA01]
MLDVKSSKLRRQLLNLTHLSASLWFVKKAIATHSPKCDRPLLPLCSLRLCGSLKRAIACKINTIAFLFFLCVR